MVEEKTNPKVSVIIPTYNRAHLIGRAIQSVLNQTYQDFEIIVVDDSSTDNIEEIVKRFDDERIIYIKHKENKGGAAARNTGIKAAQGKYIAFLDSDDEWLQNKLECEVKILNNNKNCIICSTGHTFINESTNKIISKAIFKEQLVSQKSVLRGECLATDDFTVIRKAAIKIGGFDVKLPARQDWDFWIRITSIGRGIQIPINTVNKYVMRDDQISTGLTNKFSGTIILLRKHKSLFSSDPVAFGSILSTIGLMYLLNNDGNKARIYLKKSYNLTLNKGKKVKLVMILAIVKIFGNKGITFMNKYYRLRHPNSYLLW